MKTYKTKGIVLKRKNIGEADRILTLLSLEDGKIQVIAKGVRKINSRRSSHIELLNFSELSLYKNHNFLPIVTEAQTINDFSNIKANLEKIAYAYYLCELVNSLCAENQENRNAFFLLKSTLLDLSEKKNEKEVVSNFEKELLRLLGFWLEANLLETHGGQEIIERIIEKKLKTARVIPLFIDS